jgi:hypothetical protein
MDEASASEDVKVVTGRDDAGRDVFGFLVKRVYRITPAGACELVPAKPFLPIDVYWGDPERSSPRFEAELTAFKPATDVVVLGHAYAPADRLTTRCEISIQVGSVSKVIAVFGDRIAQHYGDSIVFSVPQPFMALPLVFERAYGGSGYPRNPVGCGFVVGAMPEHPISLPNFEDPFDLLTPERLVVHVMKYWNRQPLPQGMGWFGKIWYPRMSYAGVVPADVDANEMMREEALGLVPAGQIALARQFRLPSWDARFGNGAAPGLAVSGLRGDETVHLVNLTRGGGRAMFHLPGDAPAIVADIGAGEIRPEVRLYSVIIEPDALRVTLIWGAAVAYPGPAWLPHMKRLAGFVA